MRFRSFVNERLDSMAARPMMFASNTESFLLQLMLLVEMSWVEIGSKSDKEITDNNNNLRYALCGKSAICPNVPLNDDNWFNWSRTRVEIARTYLPELKSSAPL